MGTWDIGPFDNDTAADFCHTVDSTGMDARAGVIADALDRAIGTTGYLDAYISVQAVAAAALVASQCPGGAPADPHYGPDRPLPDLTALRGPARIALDRVMSEPSELLQLWTGPDGESWRADMDRLRRSLVPRPPADRRP